MEERLRTEYCDPADVLPYDSAEGGYQGRVWEISELLLYELELELPHDKEGRLLKAITDRIHQKWWCEMHPWGLSDTDRHTMSWEAFCYSVKHERRYFFLDLALGGHLFTPAEVLRRILNYAQDFGLFVTLDKGTKLFRARRGWHLSSAAELGPPPPQCATKPNRMSPAGIPMFYASDNPETAVREIARKPGAFSIGQFETQRKVTILDLTRLPPIPSIFEPVPDYLEYSPRTVLSFLHHAARDISQPVQASQAEIEYVPTQVFTEYVRSVVLHEGTRVEGIKYASAVHQGHASFVLFATQENVFDDKRGGSNRDQWLQLVGVSRREVTDRDLERWIQELSSQASRQR